MADGVAALRMVDSSGSHRLAFTLMQWADSDGLCLRLRVLLHGVRMVMLAVSHGVGISP